MIVREAEPKDIEWLCTQSKIFLLENKPRLYNEAHCKEGMTHLVKDQVVYVAEKDGHLHGFIAGFISGHNFNPDIRVLHEVAWWVPEQSRRTRAGLLLLNRFVKWGKDFCHWIQFGIMLDSPVNKNVLTKRGFIMAGNNYILEVNK